MSAPRRATDASTGESGVLQLANLPPRSQVFVDAKPVTQPGGGIRVSTGWHELGVSAPGFLFFTDSVKVESGKTLVVTPTLSATNAPVLPPGSRAELRRRALARLDCDHPSAANRFGAMCYDNRPMPIGPTRVPVPDGVTGVPSDVVLVVKVSRQGRTLAVLTKTALERTRLHQGSRRPRPDTPMDPRDPRGPAGGRLDPGRVLPRHSVNHPKIHPSAFIAPSAAVMGNVSLGEDASVWYGAVLRGDMAPIRIGSQTNLQDGTIVHVDEGVPCTIGSRVGVGHRVILHGCTVEDECLIGMGSILLNRVTVGRGSVIAAGAVLREGMSVPAGSLVMGVPGKVVRPVDEVLRRRIEETWRHYVEQAKRHRAGDFPLVKG